MSTEATKQSLNSRLNYGLLAALCFIVGCGLGAYYASWLVVIPLALCALISGGFNVVVFSEILRVAEMDNKTDYEAGFEAGCAFAGAFAASIGKDSRSQSNKLQTGRLLLMSLIDSFDLSDYNTREDIEELLDTIEYEQSTLRGFERGAREKLAALDEKQDDE